MPGDVILLYNLYDTIGPHFISFLIIIFTIYIITLSLFIRFRGRLWGLTCYLLILQEWFFFFSACDGLPPECSYGRSRYFVWSEHFHQGGNKSCGGFCNFWCSMSSFGTAFHKLFHFQGENIFSGDLAQNVLWNSFMSDALLYEKLFVKTAFLRKFLISKALMASTSPLPCPETP